jgi:hypothetical protein
MLENIFVNMDVRKLPDGTTIAFLPMLDKALIQYSHTSKMIDVSSFEEAEAFYYQLNNELMYG